MTNAFESKPNLSNMLEEIKEYFSLDDIIFYSPTSSYNDYDAAPSPKPHKLRQRHEESLLPKQLRFLSHLEDIQESVTKVLKQKEHVVMTINDRGVDHRLCLIKILMQAGGYKIAACISLPSLPSPSKEDIEALAIALQILQSPSKMV